MAVNRNALKSFSHYLTKLHQNFPAKIYSHSWRETLNLKLVIISMQTTRAIPKPNTNSSIHFLRFFRCLWQQKLVSPMKAFQNPIISYVKNIKINMQAFNKSTLDDVELKKKHLSYTATNTEAY